MFHFNFCTDESPSHFHTLHDAKDRARSRPVAISFSVVPFHDMLERLPSQISHSPFAIPLSDGTVMTLARRDLFDARFQLMAEDTTGDVPEPEELGSALRYLDDPSDLVPLVYEGGLKTWECSLDLVAYLDTIHRDRATAPGARILEVGCGTAIPSLYILHNIFSSPVSGGAVIHVHLQDYNYSVLELVTVPNVLLTWYRSPAAEAYRSQEPRDAGDSELSITPTLLDAFKESLNTYGVEIRLFSGGWDSFDVVVAGGNYDLVLTSETVYDLDSLPSLVRLLHGACVAEESDEPNRRHRRQQEEYLCLVAAKAVYFGVGGGTSEFASCVEEMMPRTRVETVLEKKSGVMRKVMSVRWA